jgi:glycosyltransferase involved in cell wall biosynthesis
MQSRNYLMISLEKANSLFMTQPILSIITITQDEARNMPSFLAGISLLIHLLPKYAVQLVVVDSGSQDQTQKMIEAFHQNQSDQQLFFLDFMTQSKWQGFGYQKNYALNHANGDWILSLDADESVTQDLAIEICNIISNNQISQQKIHSYYIRRLNYFCGQAIHYSGWQKDIVLRLWQRHSAMRFSDDVVHERVIFEPNTKIQQASIQKIEPIAPIQHLSQTCQSILKHHPYQNYQDVLRKVQSYSTLGAQKRQMQQKKSSFSQAFCHGFWAFFKTLFVQLGLLDGRAGFNIALMNGLASYYKYQKATPLN